MVNAISKILVPTDFSASSNAALEYATMLARDHNAEIVIAHFFNTPLEMGETKHSATYDHEIKELKQKLDETTPSDPSIKFQRHMIEGNSSQNIVDFSERQHVDLIVMGTHGRTGLKHLLMGSYAEHVVRNAKCPVLTVKH